MTSPLEIDVAAEDLLVRARRNELSDNERRKLRVLLESSKELELLYLAGLEFDRSSSLVAGDEGRMRRLVEFGLMHASAATSPAHPTLRGSTPRRRSSTPARSMAIALGVGALLGAAVSAAFQYAAPYFSRGPQAQELGVPMNRAATRTQPRPASAAAAPALAPAQPTSGASPSVTPPRPPSAQVRPKPESDAAPGVLFAKAAEARRNGDKQTAIRLFERLCERHPASAEAADARLSLGKLKLEQHSAAEALRHFESYPPGTLSVEALWGRAEALRQLSSPAERATLERIVLEYPDSPYALAARKRLENPR